MTFVLVYTTGFFLSLHDITSWHHCIIISNLLFNKQSISSQFYPNISTVLWLLPISTSFCWKMSFALDRCQHQETKHCMGRSAYSYWCCLPIYCDLQLDYRDYAIFIDLDILISILNHPRRLYSRLKYLNIFTFFCVFACDQVILRIDFVIYSPINSNDV